MFVIPKKVTSLSKSNSPLFIQEKTINGTVYLDMLEKFLISQIVEDDQERCIYFLQDGAPPDYLTEIWDFLDNRFPDTWIGQDGPPTHSSELIPFDLLLEIY